MQPGIRKAMEKQEFATRERCSILEIANDVDDESVSISRARVAPGITTEWHELNDTDERYVMIAGQALVEVGNLPATEISAGDVIRIPANTAQRIRNLGSGDVLFYCVCTPRFRPESYSPLIDWQEV